MEKFKDADSVNSKTWSGRSREESVIFREETFTASPRKLIRRASLELCISQNSAHRILHIGLHINVYKLQVEQMFLVKEYYA